MFFCCQSVAYDLDKCYLQNKIDSIKIAGIFLSQSQLSGRTLGEFHHRDQAQLRYTTVCIGALYSKNRCLSFLDDLSKFLFAVQKSVAFLGVCGCVCKSHSMGSLLLSKIIIISQYLFILRENVVCDESFKAHTFRKMLWRIGLSQDLSSLPSAASLVETMSVCKDFTAAK